MILARVIGPVVSTIKNETFEGRTIYMVEPLDSDNRVTGKSFLALDAIGARALDTVLVMREGSGCRQILDKNDAPLNSLIVALVDELSSR